MKTFVALFAFIAVCAASSAQAQTFAFAGHLDDVDGPADGLFTFELSLLDDADTVVWSEQQDSVIVAAGVFALEVGASTPLPASLPGRARLAIVIDDDALDPIPLARLLTVTRAARASTASTATTTTSVGGVTAVQVATREALAAPGGPPVAFGNVTGVPASVLDGDTGVDVTTAADLSISARTLNIANVAGSRLGPAAAPASRFASGSIGTALVADGAVSGGKVGDGVLPKSRIPGALTARELKTTKVYFNDDGCEAPGEMSLSSTCLRRPCTQTGGAAGFRRCSDGSICDPPPGIIVAQCFSLQDDSIGELVRE